jgi:hypothetical protein
MNGGGVIAAFIALYLTTCRLTSVNRIRGDYMFGMGAVLIPVPIFNFWYNFGDDDYGFDGIWAIPCVNIPAVIITMYNVFGTISTSWTTIIY